MLPWALVFVCTDTPSKGGLCICWSVRLSLFPPALLGTVPSLPVPRQHNLFLQAERSLGSRSHSLHCCFPTEPVALPPMSTMDWTSWSQAYAEASPSRGLVQSRPRALRPASTPPRSSSLLLQHLALLPKPLSLFPLTNGFAAGLGVLGSTNNVSMVPC